MTVTPLAGGPTATPSRMIAGEIRAELARRGMSARQFAKDHGFDEMWLNRRIGKSGRVDMTLEDLENLAAALDVPLSVLLQGWLPRLDSNQQPSGYPDGDDGEHDVDVVAFLAADDVAELMAVAA